MHTIPSTFASQHPDHATKPYWLDSEFIPASTESQEVYSAFSELGIEEYKWDWEGKLVDESVVERLLNQYWDYFQKHPLGQEKFLTYRLPNPYVQTEQRLGRAFMGLLSASGLTKSAGLPTPPMQEVILPMCESAHSLIDIQEAFREIASLKHWLFGFQSSNLKHIQVIPLFEQVDIIANSDQILAEYLHLHQEKFGYLPPYLRPYVARSDPSLNSGHIATVLAIKIAFSKYLEFEHKFGVKLYPIIGCAALLFRGGLKPTNISQFVKQYAGVKTVLIQSGFRYDYSKEEATEGIRQLQKQLPNTEAQSLTQEEYRDLERMIRLTEVPYRRLVEQVAPWANAMAKFFPSRRERVQHTGLFGYNRSVGQVSLPRAIKFTGSMYSLGLPPSLLGLGQALKNIDQELGLDKLSQYYINLWEDYREVVGYINWSNLEKWAQQEQLGQDLMEDLQLAQELLDIPFQPSHYAHQKHLELTTKIWDLFNSSQRQYSHAELTELITEAGKQRQSLG